MKKTRNLALGLAFLLAIAGTAPATFAQDGQMLQVVTSHVGLGQAQHYETSIPKVWGAARKGGFKAPINTSVSTSDPGTYIFVVPVADWAEIGTLNGQWNQIVAANPDAFAEVGAAEISQDVTIYMSRPDLSYAPETPRVSNDDGPFRRMIWFYPKPEHTGAFETLLKSAASLNAKIKSPNPVNAFVQVAGADGPVYGVSLRAKSEADFHTENARIEGMRGADWESMVSKMMPLLRKVEYSTSMRRPDLSYSP